MLRDLQGKFENLFHSIPGALCVRDLTVLDGEECRPLRIVIYPPEYGEHGPICRFRIDGADLSLESEMGGTDRLEAILNTFYVVRHQVEALPYDVTWLGEPRMIDLPIQMSVGLGLHHERYCEELVAAEHRRASADVRLTKELWGHAPGKAYEDCEGYRRARNDRLV